MDRHMTKQIKTTALALIAMGFVACQKGNDSFSLLSAQNTFQQASAVQVVKKYDILMMIDNSASMDPFQTNLANNLQAFMQNFVSLNYDFHIAVTTTDAYLAGAKWDNSETYSRFRDGLGSNVTGVYVLDQNTPNLIPTFMTNVTQGGNGSGDERVFSSFKAALTDPKNTGFRRSDAYLAIIILSDEDDFSDPTRKEFSWLYNGGTPDHSYSNTNLETVDSYVSFLDTYTGYNSATMPARYYSVSAITVMDNACLQEHLPQSSVTIIGQRYLDMVQKTNGVAGSICSTSFDQTMLQIQKQILEQSTAFPLSRQPNPSTISVVVNGATVPQDASNGWTYDSTSNSIFFHGSEIPPQGASISVNFDPLTVNN